MSNSSERLRVFISYARSDSSPLAEDLLAGLEAAGFEAFLDRHDIAAGEVWEARLADLLQKADTIVAVLSPAFVASPRCEWELKRAAELSKRIIPIIGVDVSEGTTPEALKRLNYIFFSKGHAFGASLRTLTTALRTDVNWIREHTRLGELSARWRQQAKADALLLRGSELERAKTWLADWKPNAPEPTELHREFINQSESAEDASRNEERQRLADIAAAQAEVAAAQADKTRQQAESAKALADKEIALDQMRRRNVLWAGMLGIALVAIVGGGLFAWSQIDARNQKLDAAETAIDVEKGKNAALDASLKLMDANFARLGQKYADAALETANGEGISEETSAALLAASVDIAAAAAKVRQAGGTVNASLTMSVDVFFCTGKGQSESADRAKSAVARLGAEQAKPSGQLPFRIGRVREREWTNRAELGGFIVADEVRGDPDERALVDALAALINADPALAVGTKMTSGKAPTPYYLSIFFCSGQDAGGNPAVAPH